MIDMVKTDIIYDDNICYMFHNIDITLGLFARFGIHLFVAMRSRLSSTNEAPSIWFKIGLALISTDIGLVLSPWIITLHESIYINNICVIKMYDPILSCWVLFSDVIIGIFCLFIFVLPIREVLKYEKQSCKSSLQLNVNVCQIEMKKSNSNSSLPAFSPTITSNQSGSKSKSVSSISTNTFKKSNHPHRRMSTKEITRMRSLEELVNKIVLFSSIMLISSILVVIIAVVLAVTNYTNIFILCMSYQYSSIFMYILE